MHSCLKRTVFFCLALLLPLGAAADDTMLKAPPEVAGVMAKLHPQHGEIAIGSGLAALTLPEEMAYLTPEETAELFKALSGGQQKPLQSLGMIISANAEVGAPAFWYALLTYAENGHVKEDALDESSLLSRLKKSNDLRNEKLKTNGLDDLAIASIDWSTPPHYDSAKKSLWWGVEIKPNQSPENSYIYSIRALGRNGMIEASIVGSAEQLPQVESAAEKISGLIRFSPAYRYDEFQAGRDKLAPYTLDEVIAPKTHAAPSKLAGLAEFISPSAMILIWVGLAVLLLVLAGAWCISRSGKKKL